MSIGSAPKSIGRKWGKKWAKEDRMFWPLRNGCIPINNVLGFEYRIGEFAFIERFGRRPFHRTDDTDGCA